MRFHTVKYPEHPKFEGKNVCLLVDDPWDDFGFKTLYHLYYLDPSGRRRTIGGVKIYKRGAGQVRTVLKPAFNKLGKSYVSLGESQEFYENLIGFGESIAQEIMEALRDAAWDAHIFRDFADEDGVQTSLLRTVTSIDRHKFAAIAHMRSVLSPYNFTYTQSSAGPSIAFSVEPESTPPTNIHAVIGRNGVGKTLLLRHLITLLCNGEKPAEDLGSLSFNMLDSVEYEHDGTFANVVNVAFSAFDEVELPNEKKKRTGIPLAYIGLRRPRIALKQPTKLPSQAQGARSKTQLKSIPELTKEFVESLSACLTGSQKGRWIDAVTILGSDPIFSSMELVELAHSPDEDLRRKAGRLFRLASSGHKIVLLCLTKLVELVAERTLVLIDEPEAHLHPPLQAAFIRALSDLLAKRNGVAILATHSPVMLQEVPRDCVWMMFRDGSNVEYARPQLETFAENVGVLTREVFRFEVTDSGYHTLLRDAVLRSSTLEEVMAEFDDHVGAEGRALARVLWRQKSE